MKHTLIAAVIMYSLYIGAALAFDLKITWDANTEEDLAGYNVSYDGPASGRWATPCSAYTVSSLGVGYNTTYTIEGATVGTYGIYIRAYDTMGNMSDCTAYAGSVYLDGETYTWSTEGVDAPDDCLPVALFVCSSTTGLNPLTVTCTNQSTENSPDTWEWAVFYETNETTTPDHTVTTKNMSHTFPVGTSAIRLRVWNDTWFDDYWKYIYVTSFGGIRSGSIRNGGLRP
ncbi:MAG: hypothetical protein BWY95_02809 [Bacteroidetes bacterium ADurb.BinA104]|nr:MAG: hypothetical protein BWY95_02809 [Bacteroidetes bacterium ADurb.BinA104]